MQQPASDPCEASPVGKYFLRVTRITVTPKDEPVFSEMATHVEVVDEAAGEFVQVTQEGIAEREIRIYPSEWPAIRKAIDLLLGPPMFHNDSVPKKEVSPGS